MDSSKINAVEWFYGYGGNHIGLKRVLPNLRIVAACEISAYPVANMASKMEEGRMDSFPIWTDCKTFPREPFKDRRLDLFIASYPCQGESHAGQRKGKEDDRWLWPYCRDFVTEVRPEWCFFENVEGHITMGLRTVISDLAELGYDSTWGIFSASEVGAPHQRKRVFILAVSSSARAGSFIEKFRCAPGAEILRQENGSKRSVRIDSASSNSELGNSQSSEKQRIPEQISDGEGMQARGSSSDVSDSIGVRGEARIPKEIRGEYKPAEIIDNNCNRWPSRPGEPQHEWEEPRVVANPTNTDRRTGKKGVETETEQRRCGSSDESSNMADSESMHGGSIKRGSEDGILSEDGRRGDLERELGRTTDGYRSRVDPNRNRIDRMMLVGNGVVPATAEKAYITLLERFFKPVDEQLSF